MRSLDLLDRRTPALVSQLRRLVRVPTVNPPGENYGRMTEMLASECESLGMEVTRFKVGREQARQLAPGVSPAHPRYNVLARWRVPGRRRTVHFNAHYDVVPAGDGWRHGGPFSGAVEAGWVFGRGTSDMKGAIAAILTALRALRAAGEAPRLNLELSFTADEETDSRLGAGWLVEHAPIRPDYVLVLEGGERDAVCCGHNGVIWCDVTVLGRAAHGARPHQGVNAVETFAALVTALADYKAKLEKRAFRSPDGETMRPTLNIGGVVGQGPGAKINTVPDLIRFSLDRRVLVNERMTEAGRELEAFLRAAARRIPGCRIRIERVSEHPPCFVTPDNAFADAVAESVRRVRREPVGFTLSNGFNDMHFFAGRFGVPTLGWGPGGRQFHAIDERASLRDLVAAAKVYARLLTTFEG